jgi:hypothetical protein
MPEGSYLKDGTAYTKDGRKLQFSLKNALATELLPTPQSHDAVGRRGKMGQFNNNHYYPHDLNTALAILPTPSSRDAGRDGRNNSCWNNARPLNEVLLALASAPTGPPNPVFVAWMMDFPEYWLEQVPSQSRPNSPRSATPSFQRARSL